MRERWQRLKVAKWTISVVGVLVVLSIAFLAGDPPKKTSAGADQSTASSRGKSSAEAPTQTTVDRDTKAFVITMSLCEFAVPLVRDDINGDNPDPVSLADDATQVRDVCDRIRNRLATLPIDHFDAQAAIAFVAVDRYKSGLNAIFAYLDNPRATKIIEARLKFQEGDRAAAQARHEINQRRRAYGLKALSKG